MEGYKVSVDDWCEINFVKEVGKTEGKYHLPGEETWMAQGDFGRISFQLYKGKGFEIWYGRYEAKKDFTLRINFGAAATLFHAQLSQTCEYWCNGAELTNREGEYRMIHVPSVDAVAKFRKGKTYETFHICFTIEFLDHYANCSPQLQNFLAMVKHKKPARLPDHTCFLNLSMEDHIRSMLTYPYHGELADLFIEGRVNELLIILVHRLGVIDQVSETDPWEMENASKARKMILEDLSVYDGVEVLARKLRMTEAGLQSAFKNLYGTTVGKFSREARLKKALELLSETGKNRETLLSIALSVGYNDPGNFSTAFKQYFGYSPGSIYKRLKAGQSD
jgi:AraC-like DNA-binding protein